MREIGFATAIELIEDKLDTGEGYTLNIELVSGRVLLDYAVVKSPTYGIVQLSREDRAPIFVDVECVSAVELAGAGSALGDVLSSYEQ